MDAEIDNEQLHLDRAYDWLAWMHQRAVGLLQDTDPKDLDMVHAIRRRVTSLTDSGRTLCFGRIDREDGTTFHIGRRHVEDDRSDPVVVEWRAPVSVPFYRAIPANPLGLRRRRQFVVEGRRIQSMADDLFGPQSSGTAPRLRGGDALLAELERSRGAEMLDIVATIQAEQDEVIRSPLPGVLVCQGGPGSGKTAVGLHRAAFLLYDADILARQGVLVLGPNRVFLRYISQVLPSLGEEAVVQTTVRDLAAGVRVMADDDNDAERIKGDARMAGVIRRALEVGRRPVQVDVSITIGLRRVTLPAADVDALAADVAGRRISYEAGRAVLRDALVEVLVALHPGAGTVEHGRIAQAVRTSPAFGAALDRAWPSVAPAALVRSLVTKRSVLARAADGILTRAEQAAVLRTATPTESLEPLKGGPPQPAWELRKPTKPAKVQRRDPWTAAEVALLDEAISFITGEGRTYGHIVVDEAQDLSPMQLRMIGRRAPGGSVTLLGDLAQASGAWAPSTWEEVVAHLPRPEGWRLSELKLGYRSPADVIELASRLLPVAAPGVTPTEAVRSARGGVVIREAPAPAEMPATVAAEAARLADRYHSVAVITAISRLDLIEAALAAGGLDAGRADLGGLDRRVTLVEATQAKGLEFDAVVVADPAAIVDGAPEQGRGLRLLYVALTRPTQALAVVHAGDLPDPLTAGGPGMSGAA
jgi:DNA helicase IV